MSDLSKGYCRAAVRDLNMMSHSHSPAAVLGRENWGIYTAAGGGGGGGNLLVAFKEQLSLYHINVKNVHQS